MDDQSKAMVETASASIETASTTNVDCQRGASTPPRWFCISRTTHRDTNMTGQHSHVSVPEHYHAVINGGTSVIFSYHDPSMPPPRRGHAGDLHGTQRVSRLCSPRHPQFRQLRFLRSGVTSPQTCRGVHMWRKAEKMIGIPWRTHHLIHTPRIMVHWNHLRVGVAEDEVLVVGEGGEKAPWLEGEDSIRKATSWHSLLERVAR